MGSLAAGKDAGLIFIRTDQINTVPVVDPVATVVVSADTPDVDTVFVRGRAVKRDGALVDVDTGRLRASATHPGPPPHPPRSRTITVW